MQKNNPTAQRVLRMEDGVTHLDVRGLPPPEPLVAILRLIDACDPDGEAVLIVHLDRDPVFLYPELAERGWAAQRMPAPEGEVRLRLERNP